MEPYLEQRSESWLKWRQGKIGASDAAAIMGVSPWKTALDLYNEKIAPDCAELRQIAPNCAMRRGVELEPLALAKFESETGYLMTPRVMTSLSSIYHFMSASLDGYEIEGKCAVEIKCPGKADHELALKGKVPEKYIPQLTHIMFVCDLDWMYYMSYVSDEDFIIFKVYKDDAYTEKLLDAELEFWQRVQYRNPPEPTDRDSEEIKSPDWVHTCDKYRAIYSEKKDALDKLAAIEAAENKIKNELLLLSNNRAAHGAGIKLTKCTRRGPVNYAGIPELQGVNLDDHRKMIEYWRVSFKGEEE